MGLEGRAPPANASARAALGNLLVAWTFVTGCAAAIASAWYYRTGDLKVIIAYLGAPFLVGTALFITTAIVMVISRADKHAPLEPTDVRPKRSEALGGGRRSR